MSKTSIRGSTPGGASIVICENQSFLPTHHKSWPLEMDHCGIRIVQWLKGTSLNGELGDVGDGRPIAIKPLDSREGGRPKVSKALCRRGCSSWKHAVFPSALQEPW